MTVPAIRYSSRVKATYLNTNFNLEHGFHPASDCDKVGVPPDIDNVQVNEGKGQRTFIKPPAKAYEPWLTFAFLPVKSKYIYKSLLVHLSGEEIKKEGRKKRIRTETSMHRVANNFAGALPITVHAMNSLCGEFSLPIGARLHLSCTFTGLRSWVKRCMLRSGCFQLLEGLWKYPHQIRPDLDGHLHRM